ncbi:MAG: PilW family protein, partial [Candidatus Omnitrophota bacterium]
MLNKKGITFIELLVAAMVFSIIVAAILSAWVFAYRTWTAEQEQTRLRVDL